MELVQQFTKIHTMKYITALIAFITFTAIAANAADVTLTYTPVQLKAVRALTNRINAERIATFLAQNPGGDTNSVELVTPLSYVQTLFTAKLDNIVKQEKAILAAKVAAAYDAADTQTQTDAETLLNVDRLDE